MKLKYFLLAIGAALFVSMGAAWSVGSNPDKAAWEIAPKITNYKPSPKDTNFYYPLPEVVEVTSPFGWRIHPIYGDRRLHSGEDLGAPEGMPVLSAHSGYVRYADWGDGYGNMVIVEYADGRYQTLYGHLSEILVKDGEAVRPRQVIGKVGATGGVTGPHLHFELQRKTDGDYQAIDPAAQIKAVEPFVAVKPVDVPQADGQKSGQKNAPQTVASNTAPPPASAPVKADDAPVAKDESSPAIANPPIAEVATNSGSPTADNANQEKLYEAPGLQQKSDNITLNFNPDGFSR